MHVKLPFCLHFIFAPLEITMLLETVKAAWPSGWHSLVKIASDSPAEIDHCQIVLEFGRARGKLTVPAVRRRELSFFAPPLFCIWEHPGLRCSLAEHRDEKIMLLQFPLLHDNEPPRILVDSDRAMLL